MNIKRIEALLKWIGYADALTVADSPLLHSVTISDVLGEPQNEVLYANWHDAEGLEFEAKFTEANLEIATINCLNKNRIKLDDHEGEECEIVLFKLVPLDAFGDV